MFWTGWSIYELFSMRGVCSKNSLKTKSFKYSVTDDVFKYVYSKNKWSTHTHAQREREFCSCLMVSSPTTLTFGLTLEFALPANNILSYGHQVL